MTTMDTRDGMSGSDAVGDEVEDHDEGDERDDDEHDEDEERGEDDEGQVNAGVDALGDHGAVQRLAVVTEDLTPVGGLRGREACPFEDPVIR